MLVPSNRDPRISTVIIAPDLAIERPGRLVTNMPLHRPLLHECHSTNINSAWRTSLPIIGTLLPCPCRTHRIRSHSIGPAPVVGVDGGTTTLARDFSSTSATRITLHPCVTWKWRSYVPYRTSPQRRSSSTPLTYTTLSYTRHHASIESATQWRWYRFTTTRMHPLRDSLTRRSTFKKRGDVYW
jgi:hypothetical protein